LELLAESAAAKVDDCRRDFKKARGTWAELNKDVDTVQEWLKKSEESLEQKGLEPAALKQSLQVVEQ
jgi:hypothetical protein